MAGKKLDPRAEGAIKRTLRQNSLNALADRYPEQFDALMTEAFEAEGLTYVRELTPEQKAQAKREAALAKAKAEMDQLLADYPELGEQQGDAAVVDEIPGQASIDEVEDLSNVTVIDPEFARG